MKILNDQYIKKIFWINLAVFLVGTAVIALKYTSLPNLVPLFYNRPWGTEQLTPKTYLFIIPLSSIVVFLLNYLLANLLLRKEEKFLATIVAAFSLLFSLLGIITLIKIVFLVS